MALTDFFTLTEIKDGLSNPDRIEDLINVMRFEKDKEVENVEETSRQWSTVAKTIACTGNKECLDCFVQLGGLCFVNTWLNDILKNASGIPDGVMEESLLMLLQALEKLPVDGGKLNSSRVGITLKSLTVFNSSMIKERIHTLLDSWKLHMNTIEVDVDVKEEMPVNGCTNSGNNANESSLMETSHLNVNNEVKNTRTGPNTGTSDILPAEKVNDLSNEECSTEVGTADTLDLEAVKDGNSGSPHSSDLCAVKENISITGSMRAYVDTGYTDTKNKKISNSKSEGGSLKQNVKVLADVRSGEHRVTTDSIEHSREDKDKQPSNSCFPETKGSSLRSDDAKADKDATKASQKDPVTAVLEGMEVGILETVCGASQEKMQDGPAEQVSKSLPQTASSGKAFSSDSITVKAEDDTDGTDTEPSRANAVVQEAETETRAVLGFDLNEEVVSEDFDSAVVPTQELINDEVMINQTSMTTSVISPSRPAASSGLPAGRLQFEGTLGWKGSAATSAFRPASPRKPLESDNITSSTGPSSNSLDQRQNVHEFDLNMVDNRNADNTQDSLIAVSSSHPSEESCVEIGPSKPKRDELDLNSLGDAPFSAYWSVNGLPFSQQNAYRSPSPASSSSSVHPSVWDLDLNKKFSLPKFPYDPSPYPGNPTINFVDAHVVKKTAASEISIPGARVDIGRDEPFLQSQIHPNGNIPGFRNFLPPSINPSQPLQSFMHRPGIPITMFDPRGSSILPQMIGPAQPPYLMNMMAAPSPPPSQPLSGITPPSYSSFDTNMLYMNDAPNRSEPHTRQYLMSTQGGILEPHSIPIAQPSSFLTKRKEPHSGWDPYHHGFNHRESPGKS